MIWRLVTCFSFLIGGFVVRGAEVSGSVELVASGSRSARDSSGVVVSMEPVRERPAVQPVRARIIQKDKTFKPHVLAIPVGSTVDFPNFDPIFHNAFSNFNGQIFDIGLYPPGKSKAVTFRQAGVVRVFCNIHPAMSAVIAVVNTPYYAVTDRSGRYSIRDIPSGHYTRRIFCERAAPEVTAALTKEMEIGSSDVALPPITVSEAGYIPMPHMNKFGKAYPHGAGESGYSIPND